ncbi:MAG: RIO1 family regulatory kinase/ATPase domain-containing protein [Tepidiformaceae bacterium]
MALRSDHPLGVPEGMDEFFDQGFVGEVLNTIKAGKEATAYLCAGTRKLGARYAVAKVYHERDRRNFGNAAMYQEGRVILDARARRAVSATTEFGRTAEMALWVDHEFEVLSALQYAGADVPEPYFATERAILMSHIGGEESAVQLQHARLTGEDAEVAFERLMWNVEVMLRENWVHGDLSAFNVLWDGERPWVIDLPQAVDARTNPNAHALLERDLGNVARYFGRHGIALDAEGVVRRMWARYRRGEL